MSVSSFPIPALKFDSGEVVDVFLAYKSINPDATKKALITNCFTGKFDNTFTHSNEPSSALGDFHVVVVMQMGMGESSSPSNTPGFPKVITYQDQIRAQYTLITEFFRFSHLDVAFGYSMGGQAVYHWASMYPDFVKNGIVICASANTSAQMYAIVEGFMGAMTSSKDWDGYVASGTKPIQGLKAFGRAYIPWFYSAAWWRQEIYKTLGATSKQQLLDVAEDMVLTADPNDLIVQVGQLENVDVGKVGGGYEETLGLIKARILLLPCQTDYQFPVDDVEADLKYLKNGKMEVIPSVWGHGAGFGINPEDIAFIDERVKAFLAG